MNIDEFIERAQESARKHRYHADFFDIDNPMRVACIKSAEDCEQLAEWLEKSKEYQHLEEQDRIIKFYHCESLNEYYIGKRCGNFYYAEAEVQPNGDICLYYKWSRYLPWGEHVVDELSLWKEYTYPSEPKEISFEEWLKGWLSGAEAKLKKLRGGKNEERS